MGVRHFRDLVAWQLVDGLRVEIIALTSTPPACRDFKYCNQLRDATSSAARNIAEGFGRFRPAEFARFLEFTRGSIHEVQDLLVEGRHKGYLNETRFQQIWTLSKRSQAATTNLLKYQRACLRTGAQPWIKP